MFFATTYKKKFIIFRFINNNFPFHFLLKLLKNYNFSKKSSSFHFQIFGSALFLFRQFSWKPKLKKGKKIRLFSASYCKILIPGNCCCRARIIYIIFDQGKKKKRKFFPNTKILFTCSPFNLCGKYISQIFRQFSHE